MALTVNTPHATGTVASVSGATITLASGSAAASWLGRAFVLRRSIADRGGQWRKITAVNSPTEIEIQYPWRNSLDISDVNYEYLPQNGDLFDISVPFNDFHDGVNVIKVSDELYRIASGLTFSGNVTIFDENILIEFDNNFKDFRSNSANSGFILGNYSASGLGTNGCLVRVNGAQNTGSTSVDVLSVFAGIGNVGDFMLHGCQLVTVTPASNASYFMRAYRGSNHRVRMIDTTMSGAIGARFQGERSLVENCIFTGITSNIGPITTQAPMTVRNNVSADSLQAGYWFFQLSGSGELSNIIAKRITSHLIRLASGSATTGTLVIRGADKTEADVDGVEPAFLDWGTPGGNNDPVGKEVFSAYNLNVSADSGGGRIATFNAGGTEISNELSVDGSYASIDLRERRFDGPPGGGLVSFNSGTQLGPFTTRLRQYGFLFLTQTFTGLQDASFTWFKAINSLVTAINATAALAVTNPAITDQIYDHSQAIYELSGNMQYSELIIAVGATLTFNLAITIDSLLNAVVYDLANDSVSYSAVGDGTKLTTIALGAGQTLTLAQNGVQSGSWSIPATGTVVIQPGDTDLSAFTFPAAGATLSLASGSATVLVSHNPGILTAGAGTITIVTPQITFSAPNLTSAIFNSVRCRFSLVPGGAVQLNDDGSVSTGGINFTTPNVDTTNNTITLAGITGKLNVNTVIRFYGTDLPAPIDFRAIYYPSVDYAGGNDLSISTSPGGATLDLTDVGSGVDMFCSPWTQLDLSLITSGSYVVNLADAAAAAGVSLADEDTLVLQAIHHQTPGAGGSTTLSEYLEENFSYQGLSLSTLRSLTRATLAERILAEIGQDGSQVTGYIFDADIPSKIQIDISKTSVDTRELIAFYYYIQWTPIGMARARGNVHIENLNSIALLGVLTFDAAARSVMGGPFVYRLDGGNIVSPESQQISFNWQNTRAAVVETEVPVNLSSEVLQMLQSILALTSRIPNISGGGATPEEIYTYFTSLSRQEVFKATGFSTHSAADVWAVTTRTLTAIDKTGYSLSAAERTTLTTQIEAALLNEGDGQALIDAIVTLINTNLDLPLLELAAIANQVRSELVPELARLDVTVSSRLAGASYAAPLNALATQSAAAAALTAYDPPTRAELTADTNSVLSAISPIPTNPLLTTDSRLNNLDAPISDLPTNLEFGAAFPANFSSLGISLTGHLSRVTLVDTNADMRGTNGALTSFAGLPPVTVGGYATGQAPNDLINVSTIQSNIGLILGHTRPMAKQLGLVGGITAVHSDSGIIVSDGDGSTTFINNTDGSYTVGAAP